ncbi:hypothetical protein AOC36_05615 [Erysipelothrix larvae]|uniref:ChbG/HpnK family deacetylase n=1 Tax=Erysipelothrix larvae TaxID=1514105 RepID=A0A0X8GZT7_9FIRM|nr:ChbG/HpnK family deacetylase [Erysipelothrix larvae]AMC93474.1 hypothetical protein AOC36_05615 [Erysipelothrix larvae]
MQKKMIINSDDFGLTEGINEAILSSFQNNSISSCSLMVNVDKTQHAVSLMNQFGLNEVGVHINVTLGTPISPIEKIPSLVDENGIFHSSKWWLNHTVNEHELITEFVAQIEQFKHLTKMDPVHINYHHMIDFYGIYPMLYEKILSYNKPMRCECFKQNYPFKPVKSLKNYLEIDHYDFLSMLTDDIIELPCHIGYVDEALEALTSLTDQRVVDYEVVNSSAFKEAYHQAGYDLGKWDDVIFD